MEEIILALKKQFTVSDQRQKYPHQVFLTIDKDNALSAVTYLRDFHGFSHFVLLSAIDWIEDSKFQLTYLLNNPERRIDIAITTYIDREMATMTSAHHLWRQIATYQREIKEMYGIDFPGSPRVDEPFLLEGWDEIPPMRRDFDTKKYAEDTFFPRPGRKTHDPAEHMKQKLYPDEQ